MSLYITNCIRLHLGNRQRFCNSSGLPLPTGCPIADFLRSIVIDRRAQNNGVNGIAIGKCLFQRLQDNNPYPATKRRACGFGIKGSTVPIRRKNMPFLKQITALLWNPNRYPASQRHIAFPIQQALAG